MKHTCVFLFVVCLLGVSAGSLLCAERPVREPQWIPVRDLIVDVDHPLLVSGDHPAALATPTERRLCVCVRGVYPLQRQIAELAKSWNKKDAHVAERIDVVDFRVQRQSLQRKSAIASDQPPAWKDLALKTAATVLGAARGFARDGVPDEQRSDVMTMPLPARSDGEWGTLAAHPRLPKVGDLLFRYIDFDVKPEYFYRYWVKLTLRNPNYGASSRDPFVPKGPTRETPWSRPSPAVLVNAETD